MTSVLPSVTDAMISWLRTDWRLEELLGGSGRRIGDRLPAGETRAFIAVTRAGGGPALSRAWVRDTRLTFDVFGPSSEKTGRETAETVAERARTVVEDLTGQVTGGIVFAAVDVLADLLYLPDPSHPAPRARYVFQARAVCHPSP